MVFFNHIKHTIFLFVIFMPTFVFAAPLLVLDMQNAPQLPRHFRMAKPILENKNINWKGFSDLHMAGGGQFSKLSLEKIRKQLHTKHLTIVDLRQESHGFLNGNAISWYGPHDAANAGKTNAEIEETQQKLLDGLEKEETVTVNKILKKTTDERIEKTKPIEFYMHSVSSEAEVIVERHLGYHRFYIQDSHAPSDKEVDRFIDMVKQLKPKKWIYFHCRAGIGRTSMFMVMYDMLKNAKQVSFEDILARQVAIGGKDLSKISDDSYKHKYANERIKFLEKFYQYAHDNQDNFKTLWSESLSSSLLGRHPPA